MASLSPSLSPRSKASRRAGFTVLEFVIAAALVLLIFALVADLMLRSQQRIAHSGVRNREMPVELAFDRLRLDIRSSDAVALIFSAGLWTPDPLVTLGRSGGDVAWAFADGVLVRYPAGSTDENDRVPVLRNVESFRWRKVEGPSRTTVEIEVVVDEAGPLTARTGAAQSGVGRTRTLRLVVTPRNVDGARWW